MARPWSDDEVAALRRMRADGRTYAEIGAALGRSRKSVEQAAMNRAITARADSDPAVAEWVERRDSAAASVSAAARLAEALDWLRPVEMPPPERPKVRAKPNRITFVVGDAHFGCHDEATLTIVGLALEQLRPHRFIWNGDLFDLLAVSRYPKDHRRSWSLRDEVAAFHGWQRQYQTAADAWGCEWIETESNHSGDSAHGRWWRYLNERCPEILTHPEAAERLSYQAWFYPSWAPIQHVPSVTVGDLTVLHGYRARMHGGTTARVHSEDYQTSVVTNHTHRMGSGTRRVPAVDGRPEAIRRWFETGCACSLNPAYATAPPDWTNGWAIISEPMDGGPCGVELVNVTGRRASIAALGATLAA